ncbi:OmpA family protein [Calothrix sp. PCC 6303]|uniref:OmpA family protein n=1 Tax=Calothrix sp. PCC 6303 TaxID=1170562 RepID=UPI0002A05492|nr:OmpA family protein [Calothrix sp. PCC 6303]AFZ00386.1 OmpA/MotB domain protein [Calothrix sp. PCC 6303]
MNDNSSDTLSNQSPNQNQISDEMVQLRSLLFGMESEQLDELHKRLKTPKIQPEDISCILPEAVMLGTTDGNKLGEAIVPTVENAVRISVEQDLNVLSEALFPILGTAIRKAIASALEETIQSLNQTLNHSLSLQSLKWRVEAVQTGKSFAEIVLLRTLLYRVEQIFLIHKQTGLVLQHVVAPLVITQDPDLVSGMLTAIQDFVKDSFTLKKGDGLQSLQFGELTIWIEEGPLAVVAGIIRGNAPQEFRGVFQDTIAKIHLKFHQELRDYNGNSELFLPSKVYLENCLQAQYKSSTKKKYNYVGMLSGLSAIALSIWGFFYVRQQLRWNAYVHHLNSLPGIVITKAERQNGKYLLTGMRDPITGDINPISQQFQINQDDIKATWEYYLSLEPEIATKRAKERLKPPNTVFLQTTPDGTLQVSGSASNQWILTTRRNWHLIPGVNQLNEQGLVDDNLQKLQFYERQIEQEMFFFAEGKTEFIPGEVDKLKKLASDFQNLIKTAQSLQKRVDIKIIGHASNSGTEAQNIVLSQTRAQKILGYLKSDGFKNIKIQTVALGSRKPLNPQAQTEALNLNRRVSLEVDIFDQKNLN